MKAGGILKTFGVLLVLFVSYIVAICSYRSQFAPAPDVHTFADLQRQGVPLIRAKTVPPLKGHVCVFGDVNVLLWTLPSGPPAYHFDAQGLLVDFTLDVGDSTKFQQDYDIYRGTEIAVSDLPARFSEAAP